MLMVTFLEESPNIIDSTQNINGPIVICKPSLQKIIGGLAAA